MLIEMRADAIGKTDLPVDEIAQRLPWVWDHEATVKGDLTVSESSLEAPDEEVGTSVE